ncbi:MAG: LysM peptidoglycan-binding domain-containing protein [Myxococcota bacterium]
MIPGLRGAILLGALWLALGTANAAEPEIYEVRAGETLWSIAEVALGDASLWPALYRANRDRIKDPREVYPGQRLTIPTVEPRSVREVRREAETLLSR